MKIELRDVHDDEMKSFLDHISLCFEDNDENVIRSINNVLIDHGI